MKFHPFLDLGFFFCLFQFHVFFQSGSKGNLIYKRRSVRRIPPDSAVSVSWYKYMSPSDPAGVRLFLRLLEERAPPHQRAVPEEEGRLWGDADSQIKRTRVCSEGRNKLVFFLSSEGTNKNWRRVKDFQTSCGPQTDQNGTRRTCARYSVTCKQ